MLVFIESERAFYMMYGESYILSTFEKKQCDDYLLGKRLSIYRDTEVYDDRCDVTDGFASKLSQMSLIEVRNAA